MRRPTDLPRRRPGSSRLRVLLLGSAALIVLVFTLSRSIAGFYTDYLWFADLDAKHTFTGILGAKVVIVVGLGAVFFAACWLNLWLANRFGPGLRPEQLDEVPQRFQAGVGRHMGKVRTGTTALLTIVAVSGVSGAWKSWVLFRNSVPFGTKDPQFKKDISFYVFELPLYRFLVDWTLLALFVILLFSAVAHYLGGGIRVQGPVPRQLPGQPAPRPRPAGPGRGISSGAKTHLLVLAALIALGKAVSYYLDRFDLLFSGRGVVHGALFTDVKAKLPALQLLLLISLAAAVLLIVSIRRRGATLAGVGLALWLVVSLLVGAAYPLFVQNVRVKPDEARKEAPYLGRNIAATRAAFGLDKVETRTFNYDDSPDAITGQDLVDETTTVRNIRLWDPDPQITKETFTQQQGLKDYYQIKDVDIDRYTMDGEPTQVVIGVRELQSAGLPNDNWQNRHLSFTHGYGAVIAPANSATTEGSPEYTLKDLPPVPTLAEPRVYIGEGPGTGDYAIVGTKQAEIDFSRPDGGNATSSYSGERGVTLSGPMRRLAFALRFGDRNLLISNLVTSKSKVMYVRNVQDRLKKVAPFLTYDSDPYPVVLNNRIVWVADGLTSTDAYPYSQPADVRGTSLPTGTNYARNSVKAVVDAYDGTVDLYVIDEADPLVRSYRKAFPQLFKTKAEIPAGLAEHFRYPEDLFKAQASLYGRYHISETQDFYNAADRWNVSIDQGKSVVGSTTVATRLAQGGSTASAASVSLGANRIPPVYQLQRLPGDEDASFSLMQPYVPFSGKDTARVLTAFLSARSDPADYGKLVLYRMPSGQQINGPGLVDAAISSDATVAQQLTLLDQQGSSVLFGNILLVPIKNSILYVRPLYVVDNKTKLPKLERVAGVFGNRVEMKNSLQEVLAALFGTSPETREAGTPPTGAPQTPGTGTTTPTTPSGPLDAAAQAAIAEANAAFTAADEALKSGDLATYQKKIGEARAAIARLGGVPAGPTTSSTSTPPTTSSTG